MPRSSTRSLALLLGIAIVGSTAQGAPPSRIGEESQGAGRSRPSTERIQVHDAAGEDSAVIDRSMPREIRHRPRSPLESDARKGELTMRLLPMAAKPSQDALFASDYIVVRFGPNVSSTMRYQIARSLGGLDYVHAEFGDFGRVRVAVGEDPRELVHSFQRNSSVEKAELDALVYSADLQSRGRRTVVSDVSSTRALSVRASAATNDPFIDRQWHLERIRLEEVLQLNASLGRRQGGQPVVVAVLDTGVLFGSSGDCAANFPRGRGPDLQGATFVAGFDFVNQGTPPWDEGSPIRLQVENNRIVPGRFGHGTFVTTLIAAQWNNGVGGAGVAPQVAIMPLRVLGTDGSGTFSAIAEAINFAVRNGADVINMSLGGPEGSSVAADAIRQAHAAGVVVVAASGNEADEPDPPSDVSFPARYPEVLAVGATAFNDTRASYSNFGPGLDLVAPAGEDGRAVSGNLVDGLLSGSFLQRLDTGQVACGILEGATGTSFSAPQVAAAAALLKAIGVNDPDTIRTLLQNGARDIGAQGFDSETGHGLLDLFGAHRGFGFSFE